MSTYESAYGAKTLPNSRFSSPMSGPINNPPNSTTIAIENDRGNPGETGKLKMDERKLLGIHLDSSSESVQFFVCCGGVLFFYLIYGYVQVT